MHPNRRRKKRPNYGIRTVEVLRGANGFGFTISGQQPCILSCIVANSPADHAGLRAGDFLISVNGISVSKITHDAVANLIGNCVAPIKMAIAENYYSDSSDEELDASRMVGSRKVKYMHKPRAHRLPKQIQRPEHCDKKCSEPSKEHKYFYNHDHGVSSLNLPDVESEAGPVEYKVLVGYLGTIEMPKQLLPNSRLKIVCSCIRKLRQEKRAPTAVLMTIFPTCLTLKNSSNHILAIYPISRVVYIGSTADRESRYFGLVTSALGDMRSNDNQLRSFIDECKKENFSSDNNEIDVSNSCHVFMIDPKIVEHSVHANKAENFKITCTSDLITGSCLEFPQNALYIVNLVQNMYKLQNSDVPKSGSFDEASLGFIVANSPQPSASSNSDSGIGFRDDCGNISDRILVVEFPAHQPFPVVTSNNNIGHRPSGIDASSIPLEYLDLPLFNDHSQNLELNNHSKNNCDIKPSNNLAKSDNQTKNLESDNNKNNLNNIRAFGSINIKNVLEKQENLFLVKQNNHSEIYNRLTCRALPDHPISIPRGFSACSNVSSDDNIKTVKTDVDQIYAETPFDVPADGCKQYEATSASEDVDFQSSIENVSVHSSKSVESSDFKCVFKTPTMKFEKIKFKRRCKMVNSCNSLDKLEENTSYQAKPQMQDVSKPNYSSDELKNLDLDCAEKYGYGSLQELSNWENQSAMTKNIAQSEPDMRMQRVEADHNLGSEDNGSSRSGNSDGPAAWALSFERLLDDPFGLHTFAEFLKKEFSAENIYFWTACERYRRISTVQGRVTEANRIYQQHLSQGAPEGVNIDFHGRQFSEQSLQEAHIKLFDQAQKQIFNLMKFDSYPRFLKSTLYKDCLTGTLDRPALDLGLLLQPTVVGNSNKLKKSLSNAEDRRRKSLLPWHRKNRSKSKDRGELEYNQSNGGNISSEGLKCIMGGSEINSSKSSLASLDMVMTSSTHDCVNGNQDEIMPSFSGRTSLCRVFLSNGSTSVVQIRASETIQQLVKRLLEKRRLRYSSFEVHTDKHSKAVDINKCSTNLAGCEVTIEQRVIFKMDLPNKKVISVKSKYTKIIADVLRPILLKYNYHLDLVKVMLSENESVDIRLPIISIDEKRLSIEYCDYAKSIPINPVPKMNNMKAKLDEITNKVFEDILQEKADSPFHKSNSDKGSVKSENWGSEHSSGIFGRFLRRDSGLLDRKKKSLIPVLRLNDNNAENVSGEQIKKPLEDKWKTGVHKSKVSSCESDELVEGLTRAQQSRLEDQRGTEINFELPDFLKNRENNERKPFLSIPPPNKTKFYVEYDDGKSVLPVSPFHYENRNILPKDFNSTNYAYCNNGKLNNSSIYSQSTCSSKEGPKSKQLPSKYSNMENAIAESWSESPTEPPPLPPKPKIVPIKPQNWGHDGFLKNNLISMDKSSYLEHPSSSFV